MPLTIEPAPEDQRLLSTAAAGDARAAYALLGRHAGAAWRLAFAILGDGTGATAAVSDGARLLLGRAREGAPVAGDVRAALLVHVRRAALRQMRARPGEAPIDGDAVLATFRSLPECWRSVLWLTRGAGEDAAAAAWPLQLSATDTVALAERSEHGFAERLGAFVAATGPAACRAVGERLGRAAAGDLPPHDVALVDQHLARCRSCARQAGAALDLGRTVGRVVPPPPVGLVAELAAALVVAEPHGRLRPARPALAAVAALVVSVLVAVTAFARPAGGPVTEAADPGHRGLLTGESAWPDLTTSGDTATATPTALVMPADGPVDETAGQVGALATEAPATVAGRSVAAVAPDGGAASAAAPPAVGSAEVVPPVDEPPTDPVPPADDPALIDATVVVGPVAAAVTVAPDGGSRVAVGDLEFEVTA